MQFIQGNNRYQTFFITLEEQVGTDNAVRLIDAFGDKLDLQKLGFKNTVVEVAYNNQNVVDDKHNLIVHTEDTNVNDSKALHLAAIQAKENLQLQKEDILVKLADKGYHTGAELQQCPR